MHTARDRELSAPVMIKNSLCLLLTHFALDLWSPPGLIYCCLDDVRDRRSFYHSCKVLHEADGIAQVSAAIICMCICVQPALPLYTHPAYKFGQCVMHYGISLTD